MSRVDQFIAECAGNLVKSTEPCADVVTIALTVHGQDSGAWLVTLGSQASVIAVDRHHSQAECEIIITDKGVFALIEGRATPQSLFVDDEITVKGDPQVALLFCTIFLGSLSNV